MLFKNKNYAFGDKNIANEKKETCKEKYRVEDKNLITSIKINRKQTFVID
jgi:hypothetical protein